MGCIMFGLLTGLPVAGEVGRWWSHQDASLLEGSEISGDIPSKGIGTPPLPLFSFLSKPLQGEGLCCTIHLTSWCSFLPQVQGQKKPSNCGLKLWKSESGKTFLSLSWLSQVFYHSVRRMTSAGAQQSLGSRGVLFRESIQEWTCVTTASLVLATSRIWGQPSLGNTVWCVFLLVSVLLRSQSCVPEGRETLKP